MNDELEPQDPQAPKYGVIEALAQDESGNIPDGYRPVGPGPFDQDTDRTEFIQDETWVEAARRHFDRQNQRPRRHKIGAVVLTGLGALTGLGVAFRGNLPHPTPEFIRAEREELRVEKNYEYQSSDTYRRFEMTYLNPPEGSAEYENGAGALGLYGKLLRDEAIFIARGTNSCLNGTPYDPGGYTPEGKTEPEPGATIKPLYTGIAVTPFDKQKGPTIVFDGINRELGDLQPWREQDDTEYEKIVRKHIECLSTP